MKPRLQLTALYAGLAIATGAGIVVTARALDPAGHREAVSILTDNKPLDRSGSMPASFAPVIKKVTPSVVKIEVTGRAAFAADFGGTGGGGFDESELPPAFRRFFQQRGGGMGRGRGQMMPQAPRTHGAASGVIVSPDGYILTNNHVVDHAEKVDITLHDGRRFEAKVIGTDPKTDLAVVKINASGLPAITFADSSTVEVGDFVLAAGNPFGIGESVTMGMVSATGRATMGLDYEDFIQTDAAINPGNSGGALVDSQGRLIGINTAIVSRGGGNDGIGFAIPTNLVRGVMDGLIANGKVTRAYLGVMIQDLTPALAAQFHAPEGTSGALVGDVPAKSPGAKAGLESGDIITAIGGQPVKDARTLKFSVAMRKPGDQAEVKVLRDGSEKALTVTLGTLPDSAVSTADESSAGATTSDGSLNGVTVGDLTREVRQRFDIPAHVDGAVVTDVEESTPSWDAGLRPGDVILEINRKPVDDARTAVKLTEAPSKNGETLVKVWSKGGSRFLTVNEATERKN